MLSDCFKPLPVYCITLETHESYATGSANSEHSARQCRETGDLGVHGAPEPSSNGQMGHRET